MSDAGAARAQHRVVVVALVLIVSSVVGYLLALAFQWPTQFVLGEEPDTEVTLEDLVTGTVTSIPLIPLLVLVAAALLARSRRWWGVAATVVLTLLGGVFMVGGLGEISTDNAEVPRAVLVVAGVFYLVLGAVLVLTGLHALVHRARGRRVRPDASSRD